jgi:hypothetical protein
LLLFLSVRKDRVTSRDLIPTGLAIGATIAGSLLYLSTKSALKLLDIGPWRSYPAAPEGLSYVWANLPQYIWTIGQVFYPDSPTYGYFFTRWAYISMAASIVLIIGHELHHRRWSAAVTSSVLIAAMIITSPNPTNLLLSIFWPTPRSISPLGIFVAMLVVAALSMSPRTVRLYGQVLGGIFLAGQIVVAISLFANRALQASYDFSLAQVVLRRAYEEFGLLQPIVLRLNVEVGATDVNYSRFRSFGFGISYFLVPWARPAMFRMFAKGDVSVVNASAEECHSAQGQPAFIREQNALIVCFRK